MYMNETETQHKDYQKLIGFSFTLKAALKSQHSVSNNIKIDRWRNNIYKKKMWYDSQ